MNWRSNIAFLVLLLLLSCNSNTETVESIASHNSLVQVDKLELMMAENQVKLIDFRRKKQYEKGHIPGAINLWRSDIEDPNNKHRGMMATRDEMKVLLETHGIKPTDVLVAYDDNAGCDAARFWWVMNYYDHKQVYLLDGGLGAWTKKGGEISKESPKVQPSQYSIKAGIANTEFFISQDEMIQAIQDNVILIDARSADEYSGKRKKQGAARAGRIPGSINIEWEHAVNIDSDKHFKSLQELRAIFAELGLKKDQKIIVYCHSGVRSAHLTFVLTQLLGYKNVKNYDGSWIAWSSTPGLAVESDY